MTAVSTFRVVTTMQLSASVAYLLTFTNPFNPYPSHRFDIPKTSNFFALWLKKLKKYLNSMRFIGSILCRLNFFCPPFIQPIKD